jgi:hypothetical protein
MWNKYFDKFHVWVAMAAVIGAWIYIAWIFVK